MNFEVKNEGGEDIILLNTRLDSTTAQELDTLLKDIVPSVKKELVLDFTGADFISSIGLRVLVAAYKSLSAGGRTLAIRGANSSVKEIFRLSGLEKVFRLE